MFGIYVDSDLVLVINERPKKGYSNYDWNKIRDAVWSKFPTYDKPDCNPLISYGEMNHIGKRIYITKLPD